MIPSVRTKFGGTLHRVPVSSTVAATMPTRRASPPRARIELLEDAILPTLYVAKAAVTGIGIVGLEPIINGVLELAKMVSVRGPRSNLPVAYTPQTMKANKEDLSTLESSLNSLSAIHVLDVNDDLKVRLTTFSSCVFP